MRKLSVLFFIAAILPIKPILAYHPNDGLQVILDHQEECVQRIDQEKIYLIPEVLQVKNQCFSVEFADNQEVLMPYLFQDEQGYYLVSNRHEYYWRCTVCKHAYSDYGGKPSICKNKIGKKPCNNTTFVKVYVNNRV